MAYGNSLSGNQSLAYIGTSANQPPNWTFEFRNPNQYDINNKLGDLWMNTVNETVYVLVSLQGDANSKGPLAEWLLVTGASGVVTDLQTDDGHVVTPLGGIIVLHGGTGIATTGTVGPNTVTISTSGDVATSYITNPATGTAVPAAGVLTFAGTGGATISAAGSTITVNAGSGFTWHDITGGSATLVAQNGYFADAAGLTTFTLPTNNALGDTIKIMGKGSGGWRIIYGASQNIIFGSSTSTTTTGHIDSTSAKDCVELVCCVASATAPIFQVSSSIGNISIT